MTTTAAFEAHGFTFRIASSDADIVAAFDEFLVDMRVDNDDVDHCIDIEPTSPADGALRVRVRFDDEPLHESLAQGSLISHVLMELNRRVASTIRENGSVALHASTVTGAQRRRRARRRLALRQDDAGSCAGARRRRPRWPARRRGERLRSG